MDRPSTLAVAIMSVLLLGASLPAGNADEQERTEQRSDGDQVNAAGQAFIAAIVARDISAMDKLWAHESYATFVGPLSTKVVVGWEGVRKAWEMRFGQFDRVTISLAELHVHINGKVAWMVGIETVELLRKDGNTLGFDTFVTNVFEDHDSRWLIVSHQATPIFRGPNSPRSQ